METADFFSKFARMGPFVAGIGLSRILWQTTSGHGRTVTHLVNVGVVTLQEGRLLKMTVLWLSLGIGIRVPG
ncbi:hypothetical protein [Serratia sp. JSRIV006]|uniref:hypothetical protein n=1 Tax=Serratia sp. JSRIV006 TaxID=2831896 RepID=UPI001CC13DD6|nr:hypothetical protein [Serratia sp. JSRIV006]UAN65844.1 hypothetical protein KGP16_26670 [Serratia sp. JSRIV006]